jgi:catechol 2,3-dioxygenase-like lactoylglutathione lyase family enzyme
VAHIALVTVVVTDYDEAIDFYTRALGFTVAEDTPLDAGKRRVVVYPPGATKTGVLLARADTDEQRLHVGNQTGGRVGLFLHTTDFDRDYQRMRNAGVRFAEGPRQESYGTVGVFEDLYGNRWDLIQPRSPKRATENDDAAEQARRLIAATPHMTLATADASGKPWSSPVFFACDDAYTLYWVSFSGAVHSANIRVRPQVGITILGQPPDHEGDGVYFDAIATELHDAPEVERAIQVRRTRPQESRFAVTSPADVLGGAAWRMYRAVPVAVYKYSEAEDMIKGEWVDARVKVTL